MKYQMFKQVALGNQCRECLNRAYGLTLERRDCLYLPYPEHCSTCGQMRNIVADISRSKRWRIWLLHKTENEKEGRK
jgi:hypothetical protein